MKPRVIWLDDDIKKDKLKATVILFKKILRKEQSL